MRLPPPLRLPDTFFFVLLHSDGVAYLDDDWGGCSDVGEATIRTPILYAVDKPRRTDALCFLVQAHGCRASPQIIFGHTRGLASTKNPESMQLRTRNG